MKTKKLFSMFTTGILVTTLLVACSSKQSADGNVQGKTTGFMQLANENKERIWYRIDDSNGDNQISKDDNIKMVLVIKNGKVDHLFLSEVTLADIRGKTDDDIIKFAKKQDKHNFNNQKAEAIQSSKDQVSQSESRVKELEISLNEKTDKNDTNSVLWHEQEIAYNQETLESAQKRLSELEKISYEDIKSQYSKYAIKAIVETDASGNQVATEELKLKGYKPTSSLSDVYDISLKLQHQVSGDIYDKSYIGYSVDGEDFIITSTSSLSNNTSFGLDTLGTKNVTEE
ncbi:TPA: hypothetical protein TUT13_000979 [Streptococcus equi subsp. zooepidemicus]|nr:hypothetical protein [Streptococcus equi subsp. zooepidemicus]